MKTSMYSERSLKMKPSFIREILKAANQPGMISFAGGLPNTSLFPAKQMEEATKMVFKEYGDQALQYSATEGIPELKDWIKNYYWNEFQMKVEEDEILITSGSQQGLDLISRTFINRKDKVLIESPGYLGAINCFESNDADLMSIPIEGDGPDIDRLKNVFNFNPDIKLFYAVPTFQNPSGACYSKEKRNQIITLMKAHSALFIEDDPYGELYYSGGKYTPMKKQLGDKGILLGSFSKMLSPGLRVGWVIAEKQIIKALCKQKQSCDLHTSTLNQYMIYCYLKQNDFKEHLKGLRTFYKKNCEMMMDEIHQQLWTKSSFIEPKGGMFLWLDLPKEISIDSLLYKAMSEGVLFVPGKSFELPGCSNNAIRLNFSNSTFEEIKRGILVLDNIIND